VTTTDKKTAAKLYGKDRCQEMHDFIVKLNAYYAFPLTDYILFNFLEDLSAYSNEDLRSCLKSLEDRDTTYPLKFNEIKTACKDAKASRKRTEKLKSNREEEGTETAEMPEKLKTIIERLKKNFQSDDPTRKD